MSRELKIYMSMYVEVDEDTTDEAALENVEDTICELLKGTHVEWQIYDAKVQSK